MRAKFCLLMAVLLGSHVLACAQRADGIYHIACVVQMNDAGNGGKKAECTTHPREPGPIGMAARSALM
jgi:hypothetical protein